MQMEGGVFLKKIIIIHVHAVVLIQTTPSVAFPFSLKTTIPRKKMHLQIFQALIRFDQDDRQPRKYCLQSALNTGPGQGEEEKPGRVEDWENLPSSRMGHSLLDHPLPTCHHPCQATWKAGTLYLRLEYGGRNVHTSFGSEQLKLQPGADERQTLGALLNKDAESFAFLFIDQSLSMLQFSPKAAYRIPERDQQ